MTRAGARPDGSPDDGDRRRPSRRHHLTQRGVRRSDGSAADDDNVRQADPAAYGTANVRRWLDDMWSLVTDEADPLGLEDFATQHLPLDAAPQAGADFQRKENGTVKVVFKP